MREGYKDSTLGEIPEDWKVKKLGQVGVVVSGLTYSPDDINKNGVLVLRSSNVKERRLDFGDKVFVNVNSGAFNPVKENDILICVRNGSKRLIGKSALIEKEQEGMAFGAFMSVYRSKYNLFLFHYFDSYFYKHEVFKNLGATINSINGSDLKKFHVPFPPLFEQQKIAIILSTVDEKIDVIDQQIAETSELKKGLMQKLLTKGIGHIKFKDSPWGEIPESWEFVKLYEVAKCFVGIASSATHAYSDEGVLLLRNQNIKEGYLDLRDVLYVSEEYELLHKTKRLKAGDILTVRTGYPGVSAVVPKSLEGSQSFTTLIIRKHNENLLSEFLCYYINSDIGKLFFNSSQAGGAQKNVGSKSLEMMQVPIVSYNEQQQIVSILSTVDNKLDILRDKKSEYQEFKKGLMQQLLTGKVRVKVEERLAQ